ncbi:thiamine biosynthesis protein ThiF [Fictibacillus phosphorivorans]|uniref:Thiamine biosynthesis protein ThiF n=1 Tax=Fictibacillus phosphorivorans TaxID=1221500 RepID=A0A161TPQ2_9BACL|nr:ThiF family adenylyltransferase [Fictibacillus phosphorivorans]KZE68021.1 thiamine biosynthesis protein ThiF [Fictibacillus phosphorivorans]
MEKISIDFSEGRKKKIFAHVVIVGAGGTGGLVIQQVSQLFNVFDVYGRMVLADYDHFEEKNKANQLCLDKDIGKNKADVLAQRYRAAYQVDISTFSSSYIEDVDTLDNLFNTAYEGCHNYYTTYLPILISCVDNNFSRQVFHQFFEREHNLLYLDVGNESVVVPSDYRQRAKSEWTTEELINYNRSGYTGQLVCGLKLNGNVITEPIASVFPDILEDKDEIKPSELSCQDLAASDPQRLITNRYSAMAVNTILNEIFETGCLSTHKIFYHSKKAYMRSEQITQKED